MSKPCEPHWIEMKKIFRYLSGTLNYGLAIKAIKNSDIQVFSNSDWAGDRLDSRSHGGFLVFLGANLIS